MYRSISLEKKELMALYSRGQDLYGVQDIDCNSEDYEFDSEFDEDAGGDGEMRTSLSMDNCALLGEEEEECQVFFSNQEYYWRLEELKKTHLRNMAELEKMYIGRSNGGHQRLPHDLGLGSGENRPTEEQATPTRRLQRINSQEELDFRETSSGSDQSELSGGQDSAGELELYMDCLAGIPSTDKTCGRDRRMASTETSTAHEQQFFLPTSRLDASLRLKPRGRLSQSATVAGVKATTSKVTSKVTVPKPFRMTLREEERKRRRVRTRSEVELENALLKRELEELRECGRKFRATPAPAHTRRPLCEVVAGRPSAARRRTGGAGGSGDAVAPAGDRAASPSAASPPPRPFSFLERERRKKEARIVAALGNLSPKEESSCTFKARPLPCSVYGGPRQRGGQSPEVKTSTSPPGSPSATSVAHAPDRGERSWISGRCSVNKPVKKHMEVSIEMVKDREWSYVRPHL